MTYIRKVWKEGIRNNGVWPKPEPGTPLPDESNLSEGEKERAMFRKVARGRYMTREMVGIIQLKKYRTLKRSHWTEKDE